MLRPDDRFRLLTIGLSVRTPVPWQRAGNPITLDMKAVPGISLVYDALFVALDARAGSRPPPPDRRDDRRRGLRQPRRRRAGPRRERPIRSGAALDLRQQQRRLRSELQLAGLVHAERRARSGFRWRKRRSDRRRPAPIAIRRSRGPDLRAILDEFRQSYVLRYSPRRVVGAAGTASASSAAAAGTSDQGALGILRQLALSIDDQQARDGV